MKKGRTFKTVNGEIHTIPDGVDAYKYLEGWSAMVEDQDRPEDPAAARGWMDALEAVFGPLGTWEES